MHFYQINPNKMNNLNKLVDSLYNCQLIKSRDAFWESIKERIESLVVIKFPITITVPGSKPGTWVSIVLCEEFFSEFSPVNSTANIFIKKVQ